MTDDLDVIEVLGGYPGTRDRPVLCGARNMTEKHFATHAMSEENAHSHK